MARLTAASIYGLARAAGFDPDSATTMTAIALAESGGRDTAHATVGEDSRGLWQINAAAHPELAGRFDLYDPLQNARAAFLVSGDGHDISPWTTTHGGSHASYLRYRDAALAAAVAYGEPGASGWWGGVGGYGDHHSPDGGSGGGPDAGPTGASADAPAEASADLPGLTLAAPVVPEVIGGAAATPVAAGTVSDGFLPLSSVSGAVVESGAGGEQVLVPASETPAQVSAQLTHADVVAPNAATEGNPADSTGRASTAPVVEQFVDNALAQSGDRYVYGATASLSDPHPAAFDCSELVHWAANRVGIPVTDGAAEQYLQLKHAGLVVPVTEAIHHRGALLFAFSSEPTPGGAVPAHAHVAISLGDGTTIEARGKAYGVGSFPATTSRFQYAALLPGDRETAADVLASVGIGGHAGAGGAAGAAGTAVAAHAVEPVIIDSDRDGLSDDLERRLGLDPFQADTDHDGLSDAFEVLFASSALPSTDAAASGVDHTSAMDASLDASLGSVELDLGGDVHTGTHFGDHAVTTPEAGHLTLAAADAPVEVGGGVTVVPLLDGAHDGHPLADHSLLHPATHADPAADLDVAHHADAAGHAGHV